MPTITPLHLRLWHEALDTRFLPLARFQNWAEQQLLSPEAQPRWVVRLYDAKTDDQALSALGEALNRTLEQSPPDATTIPDPVTLHLGFLYLRYERGGITLLDLLVAAGRETDAYGDSTTPDCETFYRLANEIDDGGPTHPSPVPLADRGATLFAPFASLARKHLHLLP